MITLLHMDGKQCMESRTQSIYYKVSMGNENYCITVKTC